MANDGKRGTCRLLTLIALVLYLQIRVMHLSAGAGVLTLIATALGITSFIMLWGQPRRCQQ